MVSQKDTIKSAIYQCLKIIKLYEWLLDLYVLDFFVDNHWEKLPDSWQRAFHDVDPKTLGDLMTGKTLQKVLPLSFLALVQSMKALSLPRDVYKTHVKPKSNLNSYEDTNLSYQKVQNLFLKHVKLKKRHEIGLMAEVVSGVSEDSGCNSVIDFGSGLGHLVRVLAYKHGLQAAGIESQKPLTAEARKLDMELEYTIKKHLSHEYFSKLHRPMHFNMTLSSHEELLALPLPDSMKHYGLIGLHPCGDLGPLLLKHFVNSNNAKFICVVGCCYMKLTSNGYPLSAFVKSLDSSISYVGKEIACHAIETYSERLQKGNYEDLKVHAYRAALEKILVDSDPKLKHAPVRSIKHSNEMTFEKYCALAIDRLHVSSPLAVSRVASCLHSWRRVVLVYSLRLVLAPLVETLVLLDRMLYLIEHGLSCEIRPVFDPKISPRNHIIIGRRISP